MKKGLVMEGGGMRGMFVAGVCDVLMENGIVFDGAIGVSAGAAFGCNYKSGQIGRAIRCTAEHCGDKRYCSLWSLIKTGDLFGADYCYHEIPEKLDVFDCDSFNKNPMDFYVVCTDVETGKPIYRNCEKSDSTTLEWIRASASMPLVSRIVEIDGFKLLDGGVTDSIPLKWFVENGYGRNIVIMTQPRGYQKKKNSLLPFIKRVFRKYPKLIDAIERRHEMYNETVRYIEEKEKNGEALIIRPEAPLPVGRIDKKPEKLWKTYTIGKRIAESKIDVIKEFIK